MAIEIVPQTRGTFASAVWQIATSENGSMGICAEVAFGGLRFYATRRGEQNPEHPMWDADGNHPVPQAGAPMAGLIIAHYIAAHYPMALEFGLAKLSDS